MGTVRCPPSETLPPDHAAQASGLEEGVRDTRHRDLASGRDSQSVAIGVELSQQAGVDKVVAPASAVSARAESETACVDPAARLDAPSANVPSWQLAFPPYIIAKPPNSRTFQRSIGISIMRPRSSGMDLAHFGLRRLPA
jgi:hypothetical protein